MAYPSFGSLALRRGFGGARGSYGAPLGMGHSVQQRSGGTLPEYLPGHPGYQAPTGPLTTTLPMRPGMAQPTVTPLGQMSVSSGAVSDYPTYGAGGMLYGGRPVVSPGSGNVYYRDSTYNPSPQQRAQDDAGVARIRMYDAAAGSGPYDQPGVGAGHFSPLRGSPQDQPLNLPAAGTRFGRSVIQNIDGRTVGLKAGVTPQEYGMTQQAEAVRHGNFYANTNSTPNAANQAYAARAEAHAGGLAEGRRNRAIAQNGLTHLQPTNNFTFNQQAGGYQPTNGPLSGFSGNSNARSGGPLPNLANRDAAVDAAGKTPFAQASGFNPSEITFNDSLGMFATEGINWSPQDKQEFIKGIAARRDRDPNGFGKELNDWLNKTEINGADIPGGPAALVRLNELRAMFGKPPLKLRGTGPLAAQDDGYDREF